MKPDLQIRVTVGILQDSQPVSTSALGWLGETIYPVADVPSMACRTADRSQQPIPKLAASPPCHLVFSPLANPRDKFNIFLRVG